MTDRFSFRAIPKSPGVYVMYDRQLRGSYVGISKELRSRIEQHLSRKDSSVTTGVSTAALIPDNVRCVCWWTDPLFHDRANLEAAELIAFEIFDPALRSRGHNTARAKEALKDESLKAHARSILLEHPHGTYIPKNLDNLTDLVLELEERIAKFEGKET
jgi:hypothetical protein